MTIDESVKSSRKRIVWKVFDKDTGRIGSLYRGFYYPKGKLIERSRDLDAPTFRNAPTPSNIYGTLNGTEGLHFYSSKAAAVAVAKNFYLSYIARFAVDPADFMFASTDGKQLMYERATRVGSYIRVKG
jgi:hypothetical protein